jgi:hypothetical protein
VLCASKIPQRYEMSDPGRPEKLYACKPAIRNLEFESTSLRVCINKSDINASNCTRGRRVHLLDSEMSYDECNTRGICRTPDINLAYAKMRRNATFLGAPFPRFCCFPCIICLSTNGCALSALSEIKTRQSLISRR